MAGFVLDILLAFLFKSAARVFHLLKTDDWERSEGVILRWVVVEPGFGCPFVRVFYRVLANGHSIEGHEEIPFFWDYSARAYAQGLSHKRPVRIRVNPKNPEQTRFFELDQESEVKQTTAAGTVK